MNKEEYEGYRHIPVMFHVFCMDFWNWHAGYSGELKVSISAQEQKKTDIPAQQSDKHCVLSWSACPALHDHKLKFPLIQSLFCACLWLINSSTLGKAMCFIQSTDSDVRLNQKHSPKCTQNNVWLNVWAAHGPVKLTYKINHHRRWYLWVVSK